MTGQQLRKELLQVDFGVKPTDREVPDNLAHGIVRALARKLNIEADMSVLGAPLDDDEDLRPAVAVPAPEEAPAPAPAEQAPTPAPAGVAKQGVTGGDALHVLRKLSLDDVSKEAIARQTKTVVKKENEERRREERAMTGRRSLQKSDHGAPDVQEQIKKKEGPVSLPVQISVKEFAEKAGVQVPQVIQALMKNGVLATITQSIDFDTAAIVAAELGVVVEREQRSAKAESLLSRDLKELIKDEPERMTHRPPIVVVMGHVDHGKTSLLDAIRNTDVAAKESGGITQHIGAYQVVRDGKAVTFLDTPGHEAFAAMRARGAQITDIVILVVSAEDGVQETTVEAIDHAKDAGVPIIVALNKMDRPNADPERVKGQLAAHELQPEEWGGTTPVVPCSAVTKLGVAELLDHVLLIAEMRELKANGDRRAVGTVIESALDPALGPLATVIVNTGTLRVGGAFICGRTMGKVRAMVDAHGERLDAVPPSGAVRVSGFGAVPHVGDILQVMPSEREARDLLKEVMEREGESQKLGFADLVSRLSEGKLQQLKVVLKADTQGSLEAIQHALEKQRSETVSVKVIRGAIGAVSESDVMLAAASGGLVMAFRVDVPAAVQRTAERENIKIRPYDVIYTLLEEVESLLQGLLEPEEQEAVLGHLEVKGVFLTKRSEQIIGGKVTDGVVKRVSFRLQRGGENVGTGRITSLRKVDKDIKEAKEGTECGMRVESAVPILEGDVLEVFNRELKRKEAAAD